MHFDILTLFPDMFRGPFTHSILKRAQDAGTLSVTLHDIRMYATDRHKSVDDYPFGGGAGMVFRPDVLYAALAAVLAPAAPEKPSPSTETLSPPDPSSTAPNPFPDAMIGEEAFAAQPAAQRPPVIFMSPDGEVFNQRVAQELATLPRLVLVCGHYEGVDERVRACCFDRELSIGDYVITGGELAAMVVVDAVARLQPGVLAAASIQEESHGDGLLEYPQYTRPAVWQDQPIPEILVSGHHARVAAWRHEQRLLRTLQRRPDMLEQARLSEADRRLLRQHGWPGE